MSDKKRMKRPSYREAVTWVAHNADATEMDPEMVNSTVIVGFIADMFGIETERVTADVIRAREKAAGDE